MSDEPKLKPCPFCGSEDAEPIVFDIADREGTPARVECHACGAKGPWLYEDSNSDDWKCARLWNTRHEAELRKAFEAGANSIGWRDSSMLRQDTTFDDWQKQRGQK